MKDKAFILYFPYKFRVTKFLMKVYFYRYVLVDKWKKKNRMNTSHFVIPNELLTPQNERHYVLLMKYHWSRHFYTHTHTYLTTTTASTTTKPELDNISWQKYKCEETYTKQSKNTNCRKLRQVTQLLFSPLLPVLFIFLLLPLQQWQNCRGKNRKEECIDY